MDCQQAQESLLESLIAPLGNELPADLESHLTGCESCRSFAEAQLELDARLAEALPSSQLSPAFRMVLKARIRRDPVSAWPDFLPDLAHLGGSAIAIGILVALLPRHTEIVLVAGSAFTGVTYFLQAVLRSSLDTTA
jgi:hypothetical protein